MKLTIIPADKAVYVDDLVFSNLDLSFIPENIHALQWRNDLGWIEYVENDDFSKPANETIQQLPDWANTAVARWNTANEEQQRLRLARLAANTANTQSST
jgi:hypothetical protein